MCMSFVSDRERNRRLETLGGEYADECARDLKPIAFEGADVEDRLGAVVHTISKMSKLLSRRLAWIFCRGMPLFSGLQDPIR